MFWSEYIFLIVPFIFENVKYIGYHICYVVFHHTLRFRLKTFWFPTRINHYFNKYHFLYFPLLPNTAYSPAISVGDASFIPIAVDSVTSFPNLIPNPSAKPWALLIPTSFAVYIKGFTQPNRPKTRIWGRVPQILVFGRNPRFYSYRVCLYSLKVIKNKRMINKVELL